LGNRFLLLIFLLPLFVYAQNETFYEKLDSIHSLRKLAKNSDLELELRLEHAKNASKLSYVVNIDSTILRSNRILVDMYLNMDMYDLYRDTNIKNLKLAKKLKDSTAIGVANFGLGYYYHDVQNDSAVYYYYNAEKVYHGLGDYQNQGAVLMNIANIQESARDFIGSEATAVQAIKLVEELPENSYNLDTLWSLYNLLAIVSERLEQHDEAIENYNKCIEIADKMTQTLSLYNNMLTRNNIGFSYLQKGDYNQALDIFYELINDKRLFKLDPENYVNVLSNIAYTRFLKNDNDVVGIDKQFKEAYRISDSIQSTVRLMDVMNDMSEFYASIDKKDSALILSQNAYLLGKEAGSNKVVLKSLLAMSKLDDVEAGKSYLLERAKLSDSLLKNERGIRNKFARVRFEVDKVEADNAQLAKERLLLLFISIGLLLSLTLLYVVISQRSKNRKLEFIQKQQKANEEIYNLMLVQQDKVEEGRTKEKKRISEELHDGILGRLFGTRLSLDSLNMVQTDEAIKTRSNYINELKTIETEIRKISHDLNTDFVAGSGFIDIVKTLIENQSTAYQLEYSFEADDIIDWEKVTNRTKIHIYRMLQETMQNIYKHANANQIKISFQLKNSVILLAIEDDGSGFDVNKARKGIGLKNIDSRVSDINGKAEVFSKIDLGTIIKIEIPV
jgi:signal transduction histidine kinase